MPVNWFLISLVTVFSFAVVSFAQSCNPVSSPPGSCTPNPGLPSSTYSIDFTQQTAVPRGWTLSNWAKLGFGTKGAEFTVSQRFEAPQLWTNFYIFFGKIEVVAQVAPGTGIISSAVLMSDDADEIDWEFSGNNFGNTGSSGIGQNNYYGKGVTGWYDRGQMFDVANPQTRFHTYTVDWQPDKLTWAVDGVVIRTLYAANADTDTHQYPQSPSKFQLGIWSGGDPGNAWGTVSWAGGYTDFTKAPFTMYVKGVKMTNYNPAYAYNWTDQSGSADSIHLIQEPINALSSVMTSSPALSKTTSVTAESSSTVSSSGSETSTSFSSTATPIEEANPSEDADQEEDADFADDAEQIDIAPTESATDTGLPTSTSRVESTSSEAVTSTLQSMESSQSKTRATITDDALPTDSITSTDEAEDTDGSGSTGSATDMEEVEPTDTNSDTNDENDDPEAAEPTETTSTTTTNITPLSSTAITSSNSVAETTRTPIPEESTSGFEATTTVSLTADITSSVPTDSATATIKSSSSTDDTEPDTEVDADDDSFTSTVKVSTIISGTNTIAVTSSTNALPTTIISPTSSFTTDKLDVTTSSTSTKLTRSTTSIPSTTISPTASTSISTSTSSTSSIPFSSGISPTSPTTSQTSTLISTPSSAPTNYTCPTSHLQTITTPNNTTYTLGCSNDTSGGGILGGQAKSSFNECPQICDSTPGCVAFVYSGGKDGVGGGNCYVKTGYRLGSLRFENGGLGLVAGIRGENVEVDRAVAGSASITTSLVGSRSVSSGTVKVTPTPPPDPIYARYWPRGGRWQWNGHGGWDWIWN